MAQPQRLNTPKRGPATHQLRSTDSLMAAAEAQEERRKSHRRLVFAFALLLMLGAGAGAFVTYGMELWGGHSVPSVVNETQIRAIADLAEAGFAVEVQERIVDESVGLVLEQSPSAGERVDENTTVTIVVGIARTVPEVVGLSSDEAAQLLRDAGAVDIQITYQPSNDNIGNVLSVSPSAGSPFTASDTITLVVASSMVLPDVVGMSEDEAQRTLAGLEVNVHVTYVESDKDGRTVVSMEPGAGTEISAGAEVALSVSNPYPSSVRALAEYFTHRPADVAAYLAKEGFSCRGGFVDDRGKANVLYTSGSTAIRLCSNPFDHSFDPNGAGVTVLDSEASEVNITSISGHGNQGDVVANGTEFLGVRYEYGSGGFAVGIDGVYSIMSQCGLTNMMDSCTQDNIMLPNGQEELASKDGRHFICAYGTQNDYTWTVLIAQTEKDGGAIRAVVTFAPSTLYGNYDMSRNGNSICDFVAYVDMYVGNS